MGVGARVGSVKLGFLLCVVAALFALVASSAFAAAPSLLGQAPEDGQAGTGAGRLGQAAGIAAAPNLPGHVYVADQGNNRVDEYTAWGDFVKAWGWGVLDGKTELQTCTTQTGCQKGLAGPGTGQLNEPKAVAVDGAGNVYVLDSLNLRIQEFSPAGAFLRAFGGDVVAHGSDDSTNDEVQSVTVAATAGTFKLSFEAPFGGAGTVQTAALPYNASAAEMQSALNGLASIGSIGGSVAVTGGPGSPTGSSPYVVSFEGNLGGDDVAPLEIDKSALTGLATAGYSLECGTQSAADESNEVLASQVDGYQWLRNGVPIPGATAATYTVVPADQGKEIQCQAFAHNAFTGTTAVSRQSRLVDPAPAEPPPSAPSSAGVVTGSGIIVGSPGGAELKCPIEGWTGAASFSFSWYRNGVAIPGATGATYTASEADLASPAAFQCVVSGANAEGTALSRPSQLRYTEPQASIGTGRAPGDQFADWATMSQPTRVSETHRGGAAEVCVAAAGDVCKVGRHPRAADQIGKEARRLATDSAGNVFVGEGETIKVFKVGGAFRESIAMPEGKSLTGIATDADGDLYASFGFSEETKVRKLEPHGPTTSFIAPSFEEEPEPPFPAASPFSLALDEAGNLYAVMGRVTLGGSAGEPRRVLEFDPSGKCLDCKSEGEGSKSGFDRSEVDLRGIAAGSACGSDDVYSLHGTSFRIFGEPPDPDLCPQPLRAPEVNSQYATSVTGSEAELQARINPHFWNDTTYQVEYGTEPCSEGGCTATTARTLTSKTVNAFLKTPAVLLEGLEPATTYHYRFIAQSTGGGPVYGVDPDGEGPNEASFEEGEERAFTTSRSPEVGSCPENEAFRTGPGALLPDCRAYEMVSPLDKGNADISVLTEVAGAAPAVLNQSSLDGGKLTYGSARSFGGAVSAPLTTQYIAARGEGGWATHPISPPFEGEGGAVELDTEFWSFSPDLCESWIVTAGEPVLAPGAQPETSNLYRQTDSECGGPSYETLSTAPGHRLLALQGLSADGSAAIYAAEGQLTEDAPDVGTSRPQNPQLYYQQGTQTRFVCILPSGEASQQFCAAGGSLAGPLGSGHYRVNVTGAISADGQRVFWETGNESNGPLYVRENPGQPQSALAHGAASGTGKLTENSTAVTALVAAKGKVATTSGSPIATVVQTTVGKFIPGQPVAGTGIPAGTTIAKVEGKALTLSANATVTNEAGTTLTSVGPMPFAVGQAVSAPGIPPGTTITAVKAGELTLSKAATVTKANTPLEATSECTEATKACTLAVSAAAEEERGTNESTYLGAARDGSVVVFGTGGNAYEFDVDTRTTHLIAHKAGGGFVGMNEDASRVYFSSSEALTGPNGEGRSPLAGKNNLYLYEADPGGGQFHFIGTLLEDSVSGAASTLDHPEPIRHLARVSADGLHVAFVSSTSLTGYDNADAESEEADAEVFLYDAGANGGQGKLLCASCNPSGARPHGVLLGPPVGRFTAAWIPAFENIFYAPRVLSEDGSRLFFNSFDALLPRDTNGRADVYEWEAPGTGTCEEESPSYSPLNQGCVELISSGKSLTNSEFVDASPSGDDAFFVTLSSFDSRDTGLVDIYDARVGGGFPAPSPPPAACEGEACQSAPEAPNDQTPSSLSFEGAGNVKEEVTPTPTSSRCAKGKVKRHGRCVAKKHKHAHKRAKRNRRAGR